MNPAYIYQMKPDRWSIKFFKDTGNTSLREACVQHATYLGQQAKLLGRNVRLHLSGGDDSVAMVLSFMMAHVPFRLTTRVYKIGGVIINQEDVDAALRFCAENGMNTDLHVIDDFDQVWRTTPHQKLRDLSILGMRMGTFHYDDDFNVFGTAPFISSKNDTWSLLTTWSIEPQFSHSFYLGSSAVFRAIVDHPAFDMTEYALPALNPFVARSIPPRAAFMGEVFVYEKIVKPMIMYGAFPELENNARDKSTGFETLPEGVDLTPTVENASYHVQCRRTGFRVGLDICRGIGFDHTLELHMNADGKVVVEADQ